MDIYPYYKCYTCNIECYTCNIELSIKSKVVSTAFSMCYGVNSEVCTLRKSVKIVNFCLDSKLR